MTNKSILGIMPERKEQKNMFYTKLASTVMFSLLVGFLFTACEKYPESPAISLTSKTERVSNNWKIAQAIDDSVDVTGNYNQYKLNLTKEGTANLKAIYVIMGIKFDYDTNGTWSFVSDAEKISFNYDNNSADGVYKILKLEENEMWLKVDGGTLELHYVNQ